MGTKVLNTDDIQGVFIAADEATGLAAQAAAKAFEATQLALSAAGRAATSEAIIPHVLAILRAELGDRRYNPRGAWTATAVYKQNDLVSYIDADIVGAFVALKDVPQGVLPTDTEYWKGFGEEAAPPSFTLTVLAGSFVVAPGASVAVPLLLERFNLAPGTEFVIELLSDEPGITGSAQLVPKAADELTEDEGLADEDLVEGRGQVDEYALTLSAEGATPEGPLTLRVTAKIADWVDDPAHPLYTLTAETTLSVVVAAAGTVIAPNATAVYGMSGAAGYALAEFTKDAGPNALPLVRLGNVRPNVRADAWRSEGTPGSVLHSPPLTGHTMNGAQELGVIVRDPEALLNGAVVAAFASATRKHDYAYVYKTSEGFKVRTAVQNAAGTGAETKDSAAVPLDTRLALVCDPATQTVALHAVKKGASTTVARPTWTTGGVRASFFGVVQQDGAVLGPSVGEIVAATVHKTVLEPIRRDRNAQALVDTYAAPASADRSTEFPTGTRLILTMQPGAATRDRTFYAPATHDLRLLGDAAAGAEGGIVTSGAAGSGAETGFMSDVTWEKDFEVAFVAQDFFADPVGGCYLSLASQNQAGAFVKFSPRPAGTESPTDDVFCIAVTGEGIPNVRGTLENVGKKPAHLFFLRYTAADRKLAFSELFSGRSFTPPLVLPAQNFSGPIRLTLGFAYKATAVEFSRTRHAGVWLGTRRYNAAEEAAALSALGIAAAELTPTSNPPTAPDPAASSLVAPQNFDVSSLGSGELKRVYDELAKPGWLYMANSKRDKKVGDNPRWEADYASRYETRTHDGERYRFYTGPTCGQYFLGRGTAGMSFAVVSHAFRATKDLRLLDTACYDVETLMDAARDDSGIESNQPDGFLGFTYGCDPQRRLFFGPDDSRNTATIRDGKLDYANNEHSGNSGMKRLTGVEKALEEGLMLPWMVTALGAHANIGKFSPTYEPEGKRPATPEFYRRVRDKAIKVYENTNKKWDAYWQGRRESELPLHVRRTLVHSAISELAAAVAYAKIMGGAGWGSTSLYAECKRAWNLMFGPAEEVGVAKKLHYANWYEARHPRYGKCLVWGHHVRRYDPSGTKDATGEYLSSSTAEQYPHPNNYCDIDYSSMTFMYEEGCDFVTRSWLERCANTVLATCTLGDIFVRKSRPTPVPYPMNGGNQIPSLVSPWNSNKSTLGAKNILADYNCSAIAAYDTHGELAALVEREYKRHSNPASYPGAPSGLLLAAAKREGRV